MKQLVSYMDEQSTKRQRTKREEQGANLPDPDGQRLERFCPLVRNYFCRICTLLIAIVRCRRY